MSYLRRFIPDHPIVDLILLGGLWFFHVLNNAIWLGLDNYPPGWDSAHHLTMSLRWLGFWQAPSLVHLKQVAAASSYAPFPYHIVLPFYTWFGQDADVATLVNGTVWLGLLLIATYGLGRQIYSRGVGLAAAALVSFFPLIVAFEREYYPDLALTAVVTLALWMVVRCGQFDNRPRAVALGFALGLGTLIKWPFAFFLAGPLAVTFILVARRGGWSRERLMNLAISLGIMGLFAASQYLFNLFFLPGNLYNLENILLLITGFAGAAGHPPWYTLDGLIYYGLSLVNDQASFLFVVVFLASIPVFIKSGRRGRLALLAGIVVPYVLATLLPIKEQRFTMAFLPMIAVVCAVGLMSIRVPLLRYGLLILVLCLGVFQYWDNSYGLSFSPQQLSVNNWWAEIILYDQHTVRSPRDFRLQPDQWRHQEVVDVIKRDSITQEIATPILVPLVANTAAYNPNTFNYYSFRENNGIDFLYVWSWYAAPIDLDIFPFTYLVAKSEFNMELEAWDREGIEQAEAFIRENQDELQCIYQNALPDGSEVRVYRRVAINS